jgi:hypothetical protein
MKLIYADINKYDEAYRLILTGNGTRCDLEKYQIELSEGMELLFRSDDADSDGNEDDLIVKGIVQYDGENERWAAKIDWDAIKNMSKLTEAEKKSSELYR